MKYSNGNKRDRISSFSEVNRSNLRADCENCFGLCCVALFFSASEGFPVDKDAGKPCLNLQSDFHCSVHKSLRKMGLRGCTTYDCFGAGQKIASVTYGGHDWRQDQESSKQMFEVFLIMRQLHEMLWYLSEALRYMTETLTLQPAYHIKDELNFMFNEVEGFTCLSPDSLIELDVAAHGAAVNALLLQTSELVQTKFRRGQSTASKHKKTLGRGADLIGADLRKTDLRGANLRGAYLIAADLRGVDLSGADLIGADLRDTDLRGANLECSIFLTQTQVNATKGDAETKLSMALVRPMYWSK